MRKVLYANRETLYYNRAPTLFQLRALCGNVYRAIPQTSQVLDSFLVGDVVLLRLKQHLKQWALTAFVSSASLVSAASLWYSQNASGRMRVQTFPISLAFFSWYLSSSLMHGGLSYEYSAAPSLPWPSLPPNMSCPVSPPTKSICSLGSSLTVTLP